MIPVCEPTLGEEELANVSECVKSGWISSKGKFVDSFEKEFADYLGAKHAVTTTSGTTALHLAVASLEIGKGDEVIVPTFTMIASALPIVYTGAVPVLVDAEEKTWNINVRKIEEKITARTKAIMPVDIYGHPVDMDPILELARKHNLFVIDDAAEAHGSEYRGKKVGSQSDITCFSFYANKIITTGEGGMLVTNSDSINAKARLLKDLAHAPGRRFLHYECGFNYRMTNTQAAIGVAQLRKIDRLADARRKNAHLYNDLLGGIPGITLPPEEPWARNVYWMYSVLIDPREFGMTRDELAASLQKKGIESRPFFVPMHQQPVFQKMGLFQGEEYPVAEKLSARGINLPSSSHLSEDTIRLICRAIKEK